MTTVVHVRRGGPADAEILARLRFQFRAGLDPANEAADAFAARCAAWMRPRLAADGPWYCWIACCGGERAGEGGADAIGTIWLELIEKLPNPVSEPERHAYITSLYVLPEHRGAGAGTLLLRAALDECDRRGVDAVLLWPTPRSRSLYERHGFRTGSDLVERRRAAPGLQHLRPPADSS